MLRTTVLVAVFALAGCYETSVPDCTVSCATDDECPGDLTCGTTGLCTGGTACTPLVESCTAGEFLGCTDASTAARCNANGDGTVAESCGAPGCSSVAAGCNGCVANAFTCSDASTLAQCSADSTMTSMVDTCALGCVEAAGGKPAHCGYLSPVFIPDVCDTVATTAVLAYENNGVLDSGVNSTCDAIVAQATGPEICVIRAGTITFNPSRTIQVIGTRVIAFVSDAALQVDGTLDVAAEGGTNGPGGGNLRSGTQPSGSSGGGGAGHKTAGAAGGGSAGTGTGSLAGPALNALILNHMNGGTRPNAGNVITFAGGGGGGGGGLLLISCRGTVTVTGTIDAGGGGGGGGRDSVAGAQINFTSAGGGGSGGHVFIQGAQVNITSTAQTFANGGGGGAGTSTNDVSGGPGTDGLRSVNAAPGGTPSGGGGTGGAGGRQGLAPAPGGGNTSSSGGGGGSVGYFETGTPSGVTPTIAPLATSPFFDSNRTVPTR